MTLTLLVALNDVPTREIIARFFRVYGFSVQCADFDDRLLSHIVNYQPHVLIAGTSLNSRFHAPADTDPAFSLLSAAQCIRPFLITAIAAEKFSPDIEAKVKRFEMQGPYFYPVDLVNLLREIRSEFRRVVRLRNYPKHEIPRVELPAGMLRRGRPPKAAPASLPAKKEAA